MSKEKTKPNIDFDTMEMREKKQRNFRLRNGTMERIRLILEKRNMMWGDSQANVIEDAVFHFYKQHYKT